MTSGTTFCAIDCGNTRVKWLVHDGAAPLDEGALPLAEIGRLAELPLRWPDVVRARAALVAGEGARQALQAALAPWGGVFSFILPRLEQCGVRNLYDAPEQLGADRWAALVGARAMTRSACLAVHAGTATTVDVLDAAGNFRGGLIVPGLDLMRGALARGTARLPLAGGEFRDEPRNTDDAIYSGCLHAQAGAVERMFRRIAGEEGAVCLVSGGNAGLLAERLGLPVRVVDNLALQGVLRLAMEEA